MTLSKGKWVRPWVLGLGLLGGVAAGTVGAIAPAQAQTITFEGVAPEGDVVNVNPDAPYREAGFTFTPLTDEAAVLSASITTITGSDSDFLGFAGDNIITLTRTDGGVFDLTSVLIGPNGFSSGTTDFTIVGQLFGGGTISQTFTGLTTAQTATLNYTNLTSATFVGTDDSGIDDVTVSATAVAAPEPGSIALLLTAGVPVVGIVRRRKANR